MSGRLFSRRTEIILTLVVGASLLTFLWLIVFSDPEDAKRETEGDHELVSSYSRSALGHAAFVSLLDRLSVPVTISRFRSGERAGESAILLLLEPGQGRSAGIETLKDSIDAAERVLVVLPKRRAVRDREAPWRAVVPTDLQATDRVERRLLACGVEGRISRPAGLRLTAGEMPVPTLDRPQLVESKGLTPIVSGQDGILLGRVRGRENQVYVLSDPDVIANHGLIRGDNAAFAVRVLETVGDGRRGPVIVDETFHGYVVPPRVFDELLRYPLVVALVHLLLLLVVVYWAGSGRFGAPLKEELGFRAGKDVLIGNMAELLLLGRRTPDALRKYFRNAVAAVSIRVGLSKDLTPGETVERLSRIAASRGVTVDLTQLSAGVRSICAASRYDEGRVIALARDIHRFRKEFLDGS